MAIYTIAVQPDNQLLTSGRTQSFSTRWIEGLQQVGHNVRIVDVYQSNLREQLEGCDGFMWWFPQSSSKRDIGKRLMSAIQHGLKMQVFPSLETSWHFDDKVSQYYLLRMADLPIPDTWVFWHQDQALKFCRTASYPMVIKLASGIISRNVGLLNNFDEAVYWINRLFASGTVNLDLPGSLNAPAVLQRLRDAARIVVTGAPPKLNPRKDFHKGYLLLQEFLPKNGFDTRIAVIGNRAFGFRRFNRPDDFRASGSGLRDSDMTKIDLEIVRLAFQVAKKLNTQSIAIDGMLRGNERVLIEISYYYEGWILHEECPGHWELNGDPKTGELIWVEGHMRPEDAILEDFLTYLERKSTTSI